MKALIAPALLLFATTAAAQTQIEPLGVYLTQLYCYNPVEVFAITDSLGEKPLFTGLATIDGVASDGSPTVFTGPMMFLVNQNTGTWMAGMISPTGELCSISIGAAFEPYAE